MTAAVKTAAQILADIARTTPPPTRRTGTDRLPPTERPYCGRRSGYEAHRTAGEYACTPCRIAEAERGQEQRDRRRERDGYKKMGRPRLPEEHGTDRGYHSHYDRGQRGAEVCEPCRAAHADASRRRRELRRAP